MSVNTEIETVPDTTLVIVFDESTSMRNQSKEAVIDGLMTMIEGQPNIKRFVIWMFSTTTRKVHDGPIVTREQLWSYFNPDGMTAIYDSIWTALDDLETDTNPNKVVLFLTDGCENSSKQYTIEDTKEKIAHSLSKGVTFLSLGIPISQAVELGLDKDKCIEFALDRVHFAETMRVGSEAIHASCAGREYTFSADDREATGSRDAPPRYTSGGLYQSLTDTVTPDDRC